MKEGIKIDCEPTWKNIIPLLLDMDNKELAKKEFMKLAKLGDIVRQAQKKGIVLKVYPDGKIEEVEDEKER